MSEAGFGHRLPDQLPTIASTISAQLSLESDLASFLSERAAIEREYASKLSALVRKHRDKKAKRDQEATVGPSPTKEWSGQITTISSFAADILTATDSSSADHVNLATGLEKVSSDMHASSRKRDEIRKKHTSYANKLLADRDRVYGDRTKAKSKYDELCHEVEAHRQKREKAEADDKHAERAAKGFESAQVDMLNGKNTYLIQIAVSNKAKQKFYREDLPAVQDSLQSLWTMTTHKLTSSLARANALVASHHDTLSAKYKELDQSKARVNPEADQTLFIEYNEQRWQEPGEWSFEPCVGFFDQAEMSVEAEPTIFLQNRLIRCQSRLAEVDPLAEAKMREVEGLQNLKDAYEKQEGLGDADDVTDNLFESLRSLWAYEFEMTLLQAEIDTVVEAIGENQGQARPHRFKPASFTIPTSCDYCRGTIWGIAKQGSVCKPCGYTVHAKCEMKVPAECKASTGTSSPSVGLDRRTSRASGRLSTRSATEYSTTNSLPALNSSEALGNPVGRVVYDFDATSPFELSVAEGEIVELIEDDVDNTGWVKVKKGGKQGLVPTSYCEFDSSASAGTEPAGDAGVAQGCGQFVRALYEYAEQHPEELSLAEGEQVELTAVGFEYGEGWCEGIKSGRVGIFPSNYVERV